MIPDNVYDVIALATLIGFIGGIVVGLHLEIEVDDGDDIGDFPT